MSISILVRRGSSKAFGGDEVEAITLGRIKASTPLGRALVEVGFDLAIGKTTCGVGQR